ncbi:PPE domain-containing protein [Nocardia sp. SYP-A9097]|uniref:PPE domain-containing protein n=1 Tax=Nocardia sp. SYP-A9097 TaxID=2663237 RepID=UPI00129B0C35|nr:PPE domain-containing protein [Nocardia sp. SYP-A9097]MRH86222.1 PPE domain-containing protein [Nocardia sp. SYP-A9097]
MTLGITGVFWLPRMAELNSVTLNAGAHAIPIAAAGTAWGGLTAAWVDATTTVARVMAEVGVGLQGINGLNVLGRLTGFTLWSEQQSVLAAAMAAKAAANVTAYTVASIVMPSLPEIAAVEAARVAAHSTGGALNGTAEAAEAAKLALDIRAALVMETYEAATTLLVSTPGEFFLPPAIAMGAGSANGASSFGDSSGDPVQTALAAAAGLADNPAVLSAMSQAAQVAGTVVTSGASTAGNVASTAISAMANALTPAGAGTVMPGIGETGVAAAGTGGAALSTSAVSFGGGSGVSIGNGSGTLKLPEGWGAGSGMPSGAPTAAAVAEPVNVTPATQAAAPVRPANSSPLLGNQGRNDEDETHGGHDYARSVEHFADGRAIAPAVIGGDPAEHR